MTLPREISPVHRAAPGSGTPPVAPLTMPDQPLRRRRLRALAFLLRRRPRMLLG